MRLLHSHEEAAAAASRGHDVSFPRIIRRTEKLAKVAEGWMGLGRLRSVRRDPKYPIGRCYSNNQEHSLRFGGSPTFGWRMGHFPSLGLVAWHHTIWCSPEGELIDFGESHYMPRDQRFVNFLPDPTPLAIASPAPIDEQGTLLALPRRPRLLPLGRGPSINRMVADWNAIADEEIRVKRAKILRPFRARMLAA